MKNVVNLTFVDGRGDFQRRMRGKVEPSAPPASKESH
jgi:hypothetical protein